MPIKLPYEDHTIDGITIRMIPWKYIQAAMSRSTQKAKKMSQDEMTNTCHRSNGFNFSGIDAAGECIYEPSRCDNVTGYKVEFLEDVAKIFRSEPEVMSIELDVTYDSAESVRALTDGLDYDPQTGYDTTPPVAWRV
jgi:hypothetical protein